MRARALLLGAAFAVCACGDDGGGRDDVIDVSGLEYSPCDPAEHVGGFEIVLADGFTAVQGQVFDAVTPSRVPVTLSTDGACDWVRAPDLVCDPSCTGGRICGPGAVCIDAPVAQDVGVVTAAGLLAEVSMEPRAPAYYYSFTGTLPHPGFTAGSGMRLEADELALLGWGIEPLVVAADTIEVQSGAPVELSWPAPTTGTGPARVEVSLNVNGHGLVGSHIECVVADTGEATIPAALVTRLLDDGLSGFPTLTIRRTTTDSADTALGCVELDVESSVTLDVTIPGLSSCDGDEDCTPPETCQADLTCG